MDVLPLVFMVLMGVSVLVYVVLDGFDLGVGMLMPAATYEEQSVMVSSIGPFWDANETWLVLGVGLLLAAFPAANGIVLTALYLPVVAMLVGLMLRGVAFELRIKAHGWHRELWNWLFWFGSFAASFFQGVMLGRYVTGFEQGPGYWLFAMLVGASLCGGYVLMGATWLIHKTEGELQRKSIAWTRWGLLWVALVSLATPLVSETVREKWFSFPRMIYVSILPLATLAAWLWVWSSLKKSDLKPFVGSLAIYALAFAGLAYSLFPYVIIDRMTIWQAAAHESALKFVLVGALLVLPFLIGYTFYVYRLFGGKMKDGAY